MADDLHPLLRKRRILVETINQLSLMVLEFRANKSRDPKPYEAELKRVLARWASVQFEIEEQELD